MRRLAACLLILLAPAVSAGPHPEQSPFPVCVQGMEHRCGLLDRRGRWVIEPRFAAIEPNGGGWQTRSASGLHGMLEANGEELFAPRFEELSTYDQGLAPAKLPGEDLYGYVDWRGKWVIPPKFAYAAPFVGKLARVQQAEGTHDWVRIDRSGRLIDRRDNPSRDTPAEPPLPAWTRNKGEGLRIQRGVGFNHSEGIPRDLILARKGQNEVFFDLQGEIIVQRISEGSCPHIDQLRLGNGLPIWPADPEALCWLQANQFSRDAEPPQALRERVARLRAAWIREGAEEDRENMRRSRGAPFAFLARHPLFQEIDKLWQAAPWQEGPDIVLGEGLTLRLPPGVRYLPPAKARALAASMQEAETRLQAMFDARKGAASAPAAAPAKSAPTPSAGKLPEIALVAAPDRRWVASLQCLPAGYRVNLDEVLDPQQMLENARHRRYFTLKSDAAATGARIQSHSLRWIIPPHLDREIGGFTHAEARRIGTSETATLTWLVPGRRDSVVIEVNWTGLLVPRKVEYYADEVRALAGGLRFAPGHRYTDRQPDDSQATVSVSKLFEGPPSEEYVAFSKDVGQVLRRDEEKRSALKTEMWLYLLFVGAPLLLAFFRRRKVGSDRKQNPPADH